MITNHRYVLKTWKGNRIGTIIISIPKVMAEEYDLDTRSHVILERHSGGILIKKLEI